MGMLKEGLADKWEFVGVTMGAGEWRGLSSFSGGGTYL